MLSGVLAIARKDLLLLARDKASLFFTFVFPLLVAIFFGMIFGGGGGGSGTLSVAVVNEDGGPASLMLVSDIEADKSLSVRTTFKPDAEAAPVPMTREAGERLVRRGDATACIMIPKGFEENASSMFAGGGMVIEAVVSPGRAAESGLLTGKLNELAFKQMSRSFADPLAMNKQLETARRSISAASDVPPAQKLLFGTMFSSIDSLNRQRELDAKAAAGDAAPGDVKPGGIEWRPVQVNVTEITDESKRPRSAYELSFPQGVVWGLMGCVMAFGPSLANERIRGTMMRLSVSPLNRSSILMGKALACMIACILVQVMLLTMAVLVFKVPLRNPGMMVLVVLLTSIAFTGIMMLMAGLARTEGAASGMGRAIVLVLAMIGGGTVPLFFLPKFVQTISHVSPFMWSTLAIEGAMWRSFTPAEMALPLGVLAGFAVLGFVVGSLAMRRTNHV